VGTLTSPAERTPSNVSQNSHDISAISFFHSGTAPRRGLA
jgi:hypothetical protein